MENQTLKKDFRSYLKENNLSENTANSYSSSIEIVCKNENFNLEELVKVIDTEMIDNYDKNGSKEALGNIGHRSVINALKWFYKFALTKRHKWTYGENFICCALYIQTYIVNKEHRRLSELVKQIHHYFLPNIVENSIRAKFNNIKQICLWKGISDTADFGSFSDVSAQNKKAFDEAFRILI